MAGHAVFDLKKENNRNLQGLVGMSGVLFGARLIQ